MKRLLLLTASLFVACVFLAGCDKDDEISAVTLQSITRDTFTYKGGLGTLIVDADGGYVQASSSDPDWCRVQVMENTVLFNVIAFQQKEDRTAVITVGSGALAPLQVKITQTHFEGLIVTPTSLLFSDDQRTLSCTVAASEDYEVAFSENPNNAFSFSKTEYGVTFTANQGPARMDVSGRAVLTPTDGGEPVIVSLLMPKRTNYDYLLGTWTASQGGYSVTFTKRDDQQSFNLIIDHPSMGKDTPIVAQYVNGEVVIQGGQSLGINAEGKYVSLHYNGPQNGQGWYIFQTPGQVAWAGEPKFYEDIHQITLHLEDNGQGQVNVGKHFTVWACTAGYFQFGTGTNILLYEESLDLTRNYTE